MTDDTNNIFADEDELEESLANIDGLDELEDDIEDDDELLDLLDDESEESNESDELKELDDDISDYFDEEDTESSEYDEDVISGNSVPGDESDIASEIEETDSDNTEVFELYNDDKSDKLDNSDENDDVQIEKIVDSDEIYNYNGDIVVMDKYGKAFDFKYIDIKDIIVTKDRIRQLKSVDALQKSISATGLLTPLIVSPTITDNVYVLINGYRRLIACAKLGITEVPCVINTKITTKEMRVLEALYNHYTPYTVNEIVDFMNYLENERGIVNQSTVEYLAQMEPGDYPKLKDLLNDNDPEIIGPLFNGDLNIESAYKKLLNKRKKQSHEEKELEKAEKMYAEANDSEIVDDGIGAAIQGKGEEVEDGARQLTDEEIERLGLVEKDIDNLEDSTVEELMQEGNIEGFDKAKVQTSDNREYIDPLLRKAIINRDGGKCRCCGNAGVVELDNRLNMAWADLLDVHHIHPVFSSKVLGEKAGDTEDNLITVCLNCHRSIHLWGYGDLHVDLLSDDDVKKLSESDRILYNKELERLKKVIKLGNVIRDTMRIMGIAKERAKKEHPIKNIGRELPKGNKETNSDI